MAKPVTPILQNVSGCLYLDYFKLKEPPFSLTPDPRYLFMSERHREGLAHLFYGVQQSGGFVCLTGEIGCGKTTLSRCLVQQIPPETDIALILNPRLTAIELLATVCDELGISHPQETGSIKVLIDALNQHLLDSHARHRRTVLIIDEAQKLDGEVLEQIRLLTNLETSQDKLLQIILIGQPELLGMLERKDLRQIAQRITARYHLLPLSRNETYAYIHHRLLIAGRRDPLFTASAMRWVYRLSGGVPRLINILCDRSLLGSYALDKQRVSAAIVRRASHEAQGVAPWRRGLRSVWIAALILVFVLIAGGTILIRPSLIQGFHPKIRAVDPSSGRNPGNGAQLTSTSGKTPPVSGQDTKPAEIQPGTHTAAEPAASVTLDPGSSAFPENRAPAGLASARKPLIDHLSDSSSAFSDLYPRLGLQPPLNPSEMGCTAAQAQGYECLFLIGNWPKLRRYNLPAILEILPPNGVRKRVALVGLDLDKATFAIGGREYSFPLAEVDRLWDGSFILVWKPPFVPHPRLAPGASGGPVLWVRQALDRLEKRAPVSNSSDIYDEELQKRVLKFQHDHSLIEDGSVGNETLVRLALALEGPDAPSLTKGAR